MEFIAGIWVSVVALALTWPALVVLCCIAIWMEWDNSHGWIVFWTAVIHFWLFKYLEVDPMTVVWYTAAYVPLGTVWSIYRWKRYVVSYVERAQRNVSDEVHITNSYRSPTTFNAEQIKKELMLNNNKGIIMGWVIVWPVSVVERSLGDIAHQWWILISVRLGGIYNRITDSAINGVCKPRILKVCLHTKMKTNKGISCY